MRSGITGAGTPPALLTFTVEADTTGDNLFDVAMSDPAVVVSLILPSGAEVTSVNATSLGFTFTTVAPGTNDTVEIPSVLSLPGTHTIIQIPGGQVSGVYKIKANGNHATSTAGILATYFSSSTARAAATTDAANYKVGDAVILSGLVLDGSTPITGATITAAVSAPVSLTGQTSLSNYQLVSQQVVSSNLTDYSYSVTLTNNGSSAPAVVAQLASSPAAVTILNETLVFGDVAAHASAKSLNTITIERNPNQSFDPSTLQWTVTKPGTPVNTSLIDSGQFDAAPGDGIYTGTFTPTSPGTYTAVLSIAGTSLGGNSFSRTASTQFVVTQALASFVAFADAQQSNGVTVTATVNAQTAGRYRFGMQLQASTQNVVQATTTANLAIGTQQISLNFSNPNLFQLGVSGPYERINTQLILLNSSSGDLMADFKADAGPTAAYTLSSVQPPLYFTGQNSAAGVITGAGPSFDLLQVQIGIYSATGVCSWSAGLADLTGTRIDYQGGWSSPGPGLSTILANFSGNTIAASHLNGPYLVNNVGVQCNGASTQTSPRFQTQAFSYSQFSSQLASPIISPPAGSYLLPRLVTIFAPTMPRASIRFTTDGSTPSETAGTLYSQEFTVASTTVVKAIAYSSGISDSPTASNTYIITPVATPSFNPTPGTYTTAKL